MGRAGRLSEASGFRQTSILYGNLQCLVKIGASTGGAKTVPKLTPFSTPLLERFSTIFRVLQKAKKCSRLGETHIACENVRLVEARGPLAPCLFPRSLSGAVQEARVDASESLLVRLFDFSQTSVSPARELDILPVACQMVSLASLRIFRTGRLAWYLRGFLTSQ